MFYELIYTRCRQGIDILKKGAQISSDGYKVYSCTPAVMEEGKVDLQFLANAALAKQSFTDPGFMDDAYLYYTPDTGPGFLVNFFPVPFDANAKGDYSHRPGNFLNHAIIGDFSHLYPYQLFKDESVWTAKKRGEAYYYETPPEAAGLPERADINNPAGQYSFDEIGAFIKDGREDALKKAVSFLIAQYNEEPKKRKFLVIKDDSSRNIELWIAAIECAFSPKIASRIPFATRMDKFTTINKYTTKNGIYQTQINLQDPNHIHRYRAMIVGVHEQDKANAGLARPLANSPFVLLDGKQKTLDFVAEITNPYYQLITRFDENHKNFCRNYLQFFDINEPGIGVIDIFESLSVLTKPDLHDVHKVQDNLEKLSKYNASNQDVIKGIYNKINANLSRFLQEDLAAGLKIIHWLQNASKIVGDANAAQHLTDTVCKLFTDLLFNKSDNNAKKSNWELIKNSGFFPSVAAVITDVNKINENLPSTGSFDATDIITLLLIYLEAASKTNKTDQKVINYFAKEGITACGLSNDTNSFKEIVLILSKNLNKKEKEVPFILLKNDNFNVEAHKFIATFIIEQENIRKPADVETFIKTLQGIPLASISQNALAHLFDSINEKSSTKIFVECLLKMRFSDQEQTIILNALNHSKKEIFMEYVKELILSAKKFKDKWNFFVDSFSESKNKDLDSFLIQSLVDSKQNEKSLEKLCDFIDEESGIKYFKEISERTLETIKGK